MAQKILIRIEGYQDGKNVTGTTRTITLDPDDLLQATEIESIVLHDLCMVQSALASRREQVL